jgi:hypothetical protein
VHFSSLNGLFSFAVNMYFELARIFQDEIWQKQVVKSIMYANFYQRDEDWIIVGKYVGQIFRKLLEYQVPAIDYIYGDTLEKEFAANAKSNTNTSS